MKAALPVPHLVALVIAVIVIAALAYWLISIASKGSDIGKGAECTARKVEFCTTQSQDTYSKAEKVCKTNIGDYNDPDYWCDFCKFIPNWKLLSGEPCPTETQP